MVSLRLLCSLLMDCLAPPALFCMNALSSSLFMPTFRCCLCALGPPTLRYGSGGGLFDWCGGGRCGGRCGCYGTFSAGDFGGCGHAMLFDKFLKLKFKFFLLQGVLCAFEFHALVLIFLEAFATTSRSWFISLGLLCMRGMSWFKLLDFFVGARRSLLFEHGGHEGPSFGGVC